MPGLTTLLLKRRTRVERQVIAILRGGGDDDAQQCDRRLRNLWVNHFGCFERLALGARRAGMEICQPVALWVSADEMRIVRWLGRAQRMPVRLPYDPPAELEQQITQCALLLMDAGLHLPHSLIGMSFSTKSALAQIAAI